MRGQTTPSHTHILPVVFTGLMVFPFVFVDLNWSAHKKLIFFKFFFPWLSEFRDLFPCLFCSFSNSLACFGKARHAPSFYAQQQKKPLSFWIEIPRKCGEQWPIIKYIHHSYFVVQGQGAKQQFFVPPPNLIISLISNAFFNLFPPSSSSPSFLSPKIAGFSSSSSSSSTNDPPLR